MSAELRRRNLILVAVISIVSGAYALSFSSFSPASAVAVALGAQANNVAMLCAVLPWMLFLAALLPEDLDAAEARGSIGVLLMVSNLSSIYVFWCTVQAYSADRAAAASTDYNRWMCLHIHYGLCVFFVVWAVLVPTAHFLRLGRLRMSWAVLRRGLVVDATAFCLSYCLLWLYGEERYPPGDEPLFVVVFGRPSIGLLMSALFTPGNRGRVRAWGVAAGLLHVQLDLKRLTDKAVRYHLTISGYETPVAAGNDESLPSNDSLGDEDSSSTTPTSQGAPASHHTAKLE